jgi:ribosomal protein S14
MAKKSKIVRTDPQRRAEDRGELPGVSKSSW